MSSFGKFRLREKCGTHTEASQDGKGVFYVQPGQVVEGNSDLSNRFPDKFDKAADDAKVTATFIGNAADGGQQTLAHAPTAEAIFNSTKGDTDSPVKDKGPSNEDLNTFETIKELNAAELKAYVAENEIDVGEAKTKKDILAAIGKSMGIPTESE